MLFSFLSQMDGKVGDAQSRYQDDQQCEVEDEPKEKIVVALANACSEPYAVMVKFEHAVVAYITVTAAGRSKNATRQAKLELVEHG